jgi:sialidase-1
MFSMRSESLQHRRGIAYSPDGATQWTRPEFVNDLVDPVCMSGLDRLSYASATSRSRLIYSHCDNGTEPDPRSRSRFFIRKNLTIRLSYDEGRTWPVGRVLEPGLAGYSDITVAPDGTMFCFYEEGSAPANSTKSLVLAHFNLEWLSSGRDSLR